MTEAVCLKEKGVGPLNFDQHRSTEPVLHCDCVPGNRGHQKLTDCFQIRVVGQTDPLLSVPERFREFLLHLVWEYPGNFPNEAVVETEIFQTINSTSPESDSQPVQYSPRDCEIAFQRILELTRESYFGKQEYENWTGGSKQKFVERIYQILGKIRRLPSSAVLEARKIDVGP